MRTYPTETIFYASADDMHADVEHRPGTRAVVLVAGGFQGGRADEFVRVPDELTTEEAPQVWKLLSHG